MFVFGNVIDPHSDVLKLVEDIVRNQVIEMVSVRGWSLGPLRGGPQRRADVLGIGIAQWHLMPPSPLRPLSQLLQSRALSSRRGSRYLSPEDLIFLIRYDRAKVNRLRTYLSWKDVRKNAKESSGDAGAGADVGEGGDEGGE